MGESTKISQLYRATQAPQAMARSDNEQCSIAPWDFGVALRFLNAFSSDQTEAASPIKDCFPSRDAESYEPQSLGDFSRIISPLRHQSTDSSEPSSDHATALSSPDLDDIVPSATIKEVRWKDEDGGKSDFLETRRRSTYDSLLPAADGEEEVQAEASGFESDNEDIFEAYVKKTKKKGSLCPKPAPHRYNLRSQSSGKLSAPPSSTPAGTAKIALAPHVAPVPNRRTIRPISAVTQNEVQSRITKKLHLDGPGTEMFPASVVQRTPKAVPSAGVTLPGGALDRNGIHVFVDLSNIIIGFYNNIKSNRGLSKNALVKQPPLAYEFLALILERGRQCARRILAGSTSPSFSTQDVKQPSYFAEASKYGYEMNILHRVAKPQRLSTPVKKKRGTGSGYLTSGDSEGQASGPISMQEQCVDEILQMKMLESLLDYQEPSTLVLASGDAAEAEYSGGFFKSVTRALEKGWKVEVVSWSAGLSGEYRCREFRQRWKGKFKIIELDEFAEDLLAIYCTK